MEQLYWLQCPMCGHDVDSIKPSIIDGDRLWYEGQRGACRCGAELVVFVDDLYGTAYLSEVKP